MGNSVNPISEDSIVFKDPMMRKQVKKKIKRMARVYMIMMIILTIVFLLVGIVMNRGFMLPCFLMAGLYFFYKSRITVEYEYTMENGVFCVYVIRNKRFKKQVHEIKVKDIEIIAPHWHDAVKKYRKNGGTEQLKKYDYTSYEDDIPYFTMITLENDKKIKLLLDLDEEMLRIIKKVYPQRVVMDTANYKK